MDQLITLPVFAKECGVTLGVLQKHLSQGLTVPLPAAALVAGKKKSVSVYRCTEMRSWWRTAYRASGQKALPHTANSLLCTTETGDTAIVHASDWTPTHVYTSFGTFCRAAGKHIASAATVSYLKRGGA